ncbi:hypothetical protein SKAU_G00332980 [Synaphobranchus kaupii]|uniref:Uncharacterized protein n=1 Tax=Synaphobranchus kaupii TaxID=118154 RepID=A0A9Q1ELI7_SYNKA|nr:hypothetical protein SKAU_G00332980 [Synaphobranchus kaupii]
MARIRNSRKIWKDRLKCSDSAALGEGRDLISLGNPDRHRRANEPRTQAGANENSPTLPYELRRATHTVQKVPESPLTTWPVIGSFGPVTFFPMLCENTGAGACVADVGGNDTACTEAPLLTLKRSRPLRILHWLLILYQNTSQRN